VPFKDLVPGAIIGCQCDGLRYVVRDKFADSVDGALTRADFERSRDASWLHEPTVAVVHRAVASTFAAECGGELVDVGVRHNFHQRAREDDVSDWFTKVDEFMKPRTRGGNFRVLLCVTGLSPTAIESIKKRAQNANDPLSRAIIVDTATAPQFFERLGVFVLAKALDPRLWLRAV
jgi:hypothetical protein